jgi:hypothetical protein
MHGVARAPGEVGDEHGENDETGEQVGAAGHVSTTADHSVEVHRFDRVPARAAIGSRSSGHQCTSTVNVLLS